jgi:purine-binding chemotaxis protein CheW
MIPRRELTRITGTSVLSGEERESMRIFTIRIGGMRVGLPIARVHTVFRIERLTRVPLARPGIVGLLNLRGQITPAISLHERLGQNAPACMERMLAVGLDTSDDRFALVCDEVGDVAEIARSDSVALPFASGPGREIAGATYHQLDGGLVTLLDPDAIFGPSNARRKKAA